MIQELIEKAGQYYTGFTHLPIEGQVIAGAGMLVLLAALRNLWRMLYPVRWTAASLLRIAAFLVQRKKRKTKKTDVGQVVADIIPFDISNKKKTIKTYAFYGTTPAVQNLTDHQINVLEAATVKFKIKGHGGLGPERRRRDDARKLLIQKMVVKTIPPFDLSNEAKAQVTYDYYAHVDVAHTLTDAQMELIGEAVKLYGLDKHNGLTVERQRRHMAQKAAELQNPTSSTSTDTSALERAWADRPRSGSEEVRIVELEEAAQTPVVVEKTPVVVEKAAPSEADVA